MLNMPILKFEKSINYLKSQLQIQNNNKQLILDIITNIGLLINNSSNDDLLRYEAILEAANNYLQVISSNITTIKQLDLEITNITNELNELLEEQNKTTKTKEFYIAAFSNIKHNIILYSKKFQNIENKLENDNTAFNNFINVNNFKYTFNSVSDSSNNYEFTGFSVDETINSENENTNNETIDSINKNTNDETIDSINENTNDEIIDSIDENINDESINLVTENTANKELDCVNEITSNDNSLNENADDEIINVMNENTEDEINNTLDENVNVESNLLNNKESTENNNEIDDLTNQFKELLTDISKGKITENTSSILDNYMNIVKSNFNINNKTTENIEKIPEEIDEEEIINIETPSFNPTFFDFSEEDLDFLKNEEKLINENLNSNTIINETTLVEPDSTFPLLQNNLFEETVEDSIKEPYQNTTFNENTTIKQHVSNIVANENSNVEPDISEVVVNNEKNINIEQSVSEVVANNEKNNIEQSVSDIVANNEENDNIDSKQSPITFSDIELLISNVKSSNSTVENNFQDVESTLNEISDLINPTNTTQDNTDTTIDNTPNNNPTTIEEIDDTDFLLDILSEEENLISDSLFSDIDNNTKDNSNDNIEKDTSKIEEDKIFSNETTSQEVAFDNLNLSDEDIDQKISNIIEAKTDNEDLIISEKHQKIYLPYKISELVNYINSYPNVYSSLQDVVNQEFILPFDYFQKHPYKSRFSEAYNIMKNREGKGFFKAMSYSLNLAKNSNLNPAVIAACKTLNELESYLYYTEANNLKRFKFFNIIYQINLL